MRTIDADALKKDIMAYKTMLEIRKAICEVIDNAPTVEPERPQGEWIKDSLDTIICSNCGCSLGNRVVKLLYPFSFYYCPECGTEMEGGVE